MLHRPWPPRNPTSESESEEEIMAGALLGFVLIVLLVLRRQLSRSKKSGEG
jgi:hypothetical protein